jgi:hypothetical protein
MAAAPAPTVWSVVRDILTGNISLTADEVITKARTQGLKAPDAVIRGTVHTVRKKLKKKAARPAATAPAAKPAAAPAQKVDPAPRPAATAKPTPKLAPVAARTTTGPTTSSVVRDILSGDLELTADQVVAAAKARGLTASAASIKALVYNIRGELRKKGGPAPKVVAAAAQKTAPPAPVVSAAPAPAGLSQVLSNVAQVNAAVAAAGGVDAARQIAEAVRVCGGPEAFGQYLDLVAGIRTDAPVAK